MTVQPAESRVSSGLWVDASGGLAAAGACLGNLSVPVYLICSIYIEIDSNDFASSDINHHT